MLMLLMLSDRGNTIVDRVGGWVALYVRDTIPCKRRTDLELRDLESVWVELQVKCKRILVGGFYKPPNTKQFTRLF